jgi:hypothetical protein
MLIGAQLTSSPIKQECPGFQNRMGRMPTSGSGVDIIRSFISQLHEVT